MVRLAVLIMVFAFAVACGGDKRVASSLGSPPATETPTPLPTPTPSPTAPGATDAPAPTPVPQPTDQRDQDDVEGDSGINGRVVAGPTCPVETEDSPCPDRPISGASVHIEGPGYEANTTTKSGGRFVVDTPPGTYEITVKTDQAMGCERKTVKVPEGSFTNATIRCDTGIR